MSALTVITSDSRSVPDRWRDRTVREIHSLGETYRYVICGRCGKPIAGHVWFVIDVDTDHVHDCSEASL
jgi:hypothetical protein